MTVVVGLDLSLTSTGIAITESDGSPRCLRTVGSKPPKVATLSSRWLRLGDLARNIVLEVPPDTDLVLIEQPAYSKSAESGSHDRSGLWWIVVTELLNLGHAVVEVPSTCRQTYATGKGNASKDAVLAETVRRYPTWPVSGNDTADALVICAMGRDHLGEALVELPQLYRRGLDKIVWPALIIPAKAS